jgi:AAA+ ATPase superfamily predicted ATPase
MKKDNPFILNVYGGPEYFCNREKETDTMINAISNKRNLTLISYRRLGKSGLIKHVFNSLQNRKSMKLIYVDIMDTADLSGFVELLAREIIGRVDNKTMQLLKIFGNIVKSIRPRISVDPMTGTPEVDISIPSDVQPETSLSEIFSYLQKQEKHVIIALDEFQQIMEYPENNIEALLRKYIQQLKNTTFIFSGSQKHLLLSMFSEYGRPFYQSSEILNLRKIERETYKSFIQAKFEMGKMDIGPVALELIMKYSENHTFYVQYLCNKLYSSNFREIKPETVTDTLLKILEENEVIYFNYKKLLTRLQFNIMEAIAKEGGVNKPTSKDFIGKYHIGTPSSVKTALTALLKKEMIYQDEGKIDVYDIFFSKWLERRK